MHSGSRWSPQRLGFVTITARYGYQDEPDVPAALEAQRKGLGIDLDDVVLRQPRVAGTGRRRADGRLADAAVRAAAQEFDARRPLLPHPTRPGCRGGRVRRDVRPGRLSRPGDGVTRQPGTLQRRGRDSNPRTRNPPLRDFQSRSLSQLGHLSCDPSMTSHRRPLLPGVQSAVLCAPPAKRGVAWQTSASRSWDEYRSSTVYPSGSSRRWPTQRRSAATTRAT